jgi:hypothetical protein
LQGGMSLEEGLYLKDNSFQRWKGFISWKDEVGFLGTLRSGPEFCRRTDGQAFPQDAWSQPSSNDGFDGLKALLPRRGVVGNAGIKVEWSAWTRCHYFIRSRCNFSMKTHVFQPKGSCEGLFKSTSLYFGRWYPSYILWSVSTQTMFWCEISILN